MALSFGISPTQDCGKITFKNCSTYCTPTNYDVAFCIARVESVIDQHRNSIIVQAGYETTSAVSDPSTQIEWSGTFFTTQTGPIALIQNLNTAGTVYTINLQVTDDDGLISTTELKVRQGTSDILWAASAGIELTTQSPNPDLIVGISDNSYLDGYTVDDTTIQLLPENPGAPTLTSMPQNYDYGSVGTYEISYTFNGTNNQTLTTIVPIILTANNADCTSELTETGLDSIILTITDPSNESYTYDITDDFFDSPLTLNSTDVVDTDTWASGIWTFRLIVTKDNGVQIVSEIKVTLICAEECAFNAALINYANEETNCCDECKNEKEENLILLRTYIDAIKNANACGSTTQITKFLSLVQRKLANTNCNCSGYN